MLSRISLFKNSKNKTQLKDSILTDRIGKQVVVAFEGPHAEWRTVGGIARQTGLSEQEIVKCIEEHEEAFKESSVKLGGKVLYGLR